MQRKIRLMIGILIMTGLIAGCWKVSKNLQKELKEEMETIGEAEKSDRIVVLDAGHGGTDSGKVGINGVKEKDINLTITNSVKKILEKENIQVIMTRETDKQLAQSKVEDLKYRVKIMNETSPVLAVSIHQNSYHEENVFGAQVFYYQTSTEGEKAAGIIQDALQKVNPDNTKKIKANNTYYILKKTVLLVHSQKKCKIFQLEQKVSKCHQTVFFKHRMLLFMEQFLQIKGQSAGLILRHA